MIFRLAIPQSNVRVPGATVLKKPMLYFQEKLDTLKQWAVRTGEGRSLILKTSILKTKELSEKGLPNNQFG